MKKRHQSSVILIELALCKGRATAISAKGNLPKDAIRRILEAVGIQK